MVSPHNTGKGAYQTLLKDIAKAGVCPFCPGEFQKLNPPPLRTENGWFAAASIRKYRNASHHFLIISTEHKVSVNELTASDMETVLSLTKWLIKEYRLEGVGFFLRAGSMRRTNATVQHLHVHVIQCDIDKTWPWWTREHWLAKFFPKRRATWIQLGCPSAKS